MSKTKHISLTEQVYGRPACVPENHFLHLKHRSPDQPLAGAPVDLGRIPKGNLTPTSPKWTHRHD